MSYGGGKIFSSIKTTSAAGCRTWEAFMSYMAENLAMNSIWCPDGSWEMRLTALMTGTMRAEKA